MSHSGEQFKQYEFGLNNFIPITIAMSVFNCLSLIVIDFASSEKVSIFTPSISVG